MLYNWKTKLEEKQTDKQLNEMLEKYVNSVNESLKAFNVRLADLNVKVAQAEKQSSDPAALEHEENQLQIDAMETTLTQLHAEWMELATAINKQMNGTTQEKLAMIQSPEYKRFNEIAQEKNRLNKELKQQKERKKEYLKKQPAERVSVSSLEKDRRKLDEDWALLQIQNERMDHLKNILF